MKKTSLYVAVLLPLCISTLPGQVSGRISGTVVDPSNAAVSNAKVEVYLAGGKTAIFQTTTTSEGLFSFGGVRPDYYDLSVEAPGFIKVTVRSVKVDPLRETVVPPVKMELAQVSQIIEVAAEIESVQLANSQIAQTVTNEQIRNLPVLDRQVINLITSQAGVSDGRGPTVINGMRTSFATVTIDGINIQDNFIRSNSLSFIPNRITIDQVAEVTISTSNANSTVGGGAAQVSFVTPSGGNEYHGNLYWYNRNSAAAANDWFNNLDGVEKPFLNQNQFGGSIGGPIFKDKLLFYSNYEGLRLSQQALVNRTILTEDARRGIYTYQDSAGAVRKINLLQQKGLQIDPAIGQLLQRVPGPENANNFRLGDSRATLLRNTIGYSFNMRDNLERDNFTLKMDYILSTKHTFSGSWLWNREFSDRSDLDNSFNRIPAVFNDSSRNLVSLSWRWNPAPAWTNELRGGFNLAPSRFENSEKFGDYILDYTTPVFSYPVASRLLPQGRDTNTYVIQDNASWTSGRHTWQFGFQSQMIHTDPYNFAGIIPTYDIGMSARNPNALTTADLPGIRSQDLSGANNYLATMAGFVSSATQTFNVTGRDSGFVSGAPDKRRYRFSNYAWYAQDTWKIRPRLTLSLGLRYEYFTRVDEKDALALLPRIEGGNFINTLLSNATLDFAGGAVDRPWYKRDLNNFAPNVGLAWDVFGNGRTALRAGYSISYVNDDTIVAVRNTVNTNDGLQADSTLAGTVGRLTGSLPVIPKPTYKVPRTLQDNYALDPFTAMGLPDPGLVTPYVQQWTFGLQQELKGFVLEARYVGNKLTKGLRAFDYNQIEIRESGFLDDFIRARRNGELARAATGTFNPAYTGPGTQPLTVFPRLPGGGLLTNGTVRGLIERGEAGELASVYQTNNLNGPINFFRNPFGLGMNSMTNYSNSIYHALQLDARKRTRSGAVFQINYTFSKVLSDSLGDSQTRFEPFLDFNNPKLERARAPFDITHAIKGNFVYELPMGKGRFLSSDKLDRVIGGWKLGGNMVWQSGSPFSVLSNRATLNRSARSTARNTANTNLTKDELDKVVGFFMTGNGPYFINPSAIGPDGRGVAADGRPAFNGQVFFNPDPGTVGGLQRRMFSGPWTFAFDASLVKVTPITEKQSIELRVEAINVFNHPTFYVGDEASASTRFNINATTFGVINGNFTSSRLIQFGLYYRF